MKKGFSHAILLAAAISSSGSILAAGQAILSKDDVVITQEDYKLFLQTMMTPEQLTAVAANDQRLREVLANYFVTSVLEADARKEGLDKDPEYLIKQRFDEKSRLSQAYLEHEAAKIPMPDFTVKAKEDYALNKEKYIQPESVRAEHILIAVNETRDQPQAAARAKEVYQKATAKGADFAALAKEYSDDPSVERNGGDLGFFTKDRMVQTFADAAFSMKTGTISQPVKSSFGYHIIRKLEQRSESVMSFDAVRADLIAAAKLEYINNFKRQKIEKIRAAADIKFNQQAYDELVKSIRK